MYRTVETSPGNFETIDFIEPSNPNRPSFWSESDKDYLFDHMYEYVDHVNGAYPMRAKQMSVYNHLIPSLDSSDTFTHPKLLCHALPHGLRRHGAFTPHLFRSYKDICKQRDELEAARALSSANDRLTKHGYSFAMSDDEIRRLADSKSRAFSRLVQAIPDVEAQFSKVVTLLDSLGLAFRESQIETARDNDELFSLVNRALDENWLVRQLRRKCAYEVEQIARDLGLVQRHKQTYCSDFSVKRHRDRMQSNDIALEKTVAYDEDDLNNWFTLASLSEKSVSNPTIRRCEMFTRLRGFEEYAQENGHDAVFFTVTAPSRFHAISKGVVNSKWIKAGKPEARDVHNYLMGVWQALGKVLAKKQIKLYGMRIVEPHQDGTPHHHFLLFMEKQDRPFIVSEFKRLAFADTPNEKGAKEHRFKAELIDWSQGSAVGYCAKYLSKNIDGKHIDKDKGSHLDGITAAERVVTWARVNRIRQFQFIGGPSVTVWRELRRLREEFQEDDAMLTDLDDTQHYLLEKVRRSADEGDWKAFCYAMGGVFVKRKDQKVKVQYTVPNSIEALIASGGEFTPTRFGDSAQGRINGLLFEQVFLATRFRNWKVENKEQFIKAQQGIMTNVVDFFDALEREQEYERMAEKHFQDYERYMHQCDELEALLWSGSSEAIASCSVSEAPPDWMH